MGSDRRYCIVQLGMAYQAANRSDYAKLHVAAIYSHAVLSTQTCRVVEKQTALPTVLDC
jgi:hypothetical protein